MWNRKKCHIWVPAQIEGGARGAPLWPLTFFSDAGPGRVKVFFFRKLNFLYNIDLHDMLRQKGFRSFSSDVCPFCTGYMVIVPLPGNSSTLLLCPKNFYIFVRFFDCVMIFFRCVSTSRFHKFCVCVCVCLCVCPPFCLYYFILYTPPYSIQSCIVR